MKKAFFLVFILSISTYAIIYAQHHAVNGHKTNINWQSAIVKIESIQQRYNVEQADVLLHKQIDTIKGLSQHDKFERQGELLTIRDTIRGTGILISSGNGIYLVTAKHIVKATENSGNEAESINDLISIKAYAGKLISNNIPLMNLSAPSTSLRPFVFSSDAEDIAVISLQKKSYKAIVAYLKQIGCKAVLTQIIGEAKNNDKVSVVGFPALPDASVNNITTTEGAIETTTATGFKVQVPVYPGNSGSPVIQNEKLIGILSFQSGINNNIDAALHPYQKANSAMATKSALILQLLKQLQANEKRIGFNN